MREGESDCISEQSFQTTPQFPICSCGDCHMLKRSQASKEPTRVEYKNEICWSLQKHLALVIHADKTSKENTKSAMHPRYQMRYTPTEQPSKQKQNGNVTAARQEQECGFYIAKGHLPPNANPAGVVGGLEWLVHRPSVTTRVQKEWSKLPCR